MFRLIFTNEVSDDKLVPDTFETEAAAADYAKPYIENGSCRSARILRLIAELTAVTTIQRRPVNG